MALNKYGYYYYYCCCCCCCCLTPVLNSKGMKKLAVQYKKYKNQAGMNLTPPLPQNYREVRWHCTAIIIITTTIRGKVGGVAQW